jgi:thiazole synthase ThiGH ThiG subunit
VTTRSAPSDVAQAFANGADYIVVGRPIRDAADPRAAAQSMPEGRSQRHSRHDPGARRHRRLAGDRMDFQ